MPTLWQASQRPMYVRTVWVDGFRHAILTHDDPYYRELQKRRPHSSASCARPKYTPRERSETPDLQDCLKKFHFVIRSNKSRSAKTRPCSHAIHVETLNLTDVEETDDELELKGRPQIPCEIDSDHSSEASNMKTLRSNRTTRPAENTELSDRVLQWLDLAGKVDLLAPENVDRMNQPRHSWPELQRRNVKPKTATAIEYKIKESKTDSAKAPRSGYIDRVDFYVPMSANTIENYARQSRNKHTPRHDHVQKDVNKYAKTVRSSVLDVKPKVDTNIQETRRKMEMERSAVAKQYAELVNKKLIPDVGKGNRKQVHIFMPDLPKRSGSNANSRTESLLSHKSIAASRIESLLSLKS